MAAPSSRWLDIFAVSDRERVRPRSPRLFHPLRGDRRATRRRRCGRGAPSVRNASASGLCTRLGGEVFPRIARYPRTECSGRCDDGRSVVAVVRSGRSAVGLAPTPAHPLTLRSSGPRQFRQERARCFRDHTQVALEARFAHDFAGRHCDLDAHAIAAERIHILVPDIGRLERSVIARMLRVFWSSGFFALNGVDVYPRNNRVSTRMHLCRYEEKRCTMWQ